VITPAFRLLVLRGQLHLLCLLCDTFSCHPEDVSQRYCWRCNQFLDELPEDYRREAPLLPPARRPIAQQE
jgi:hypothetical protein